MPTTVTSSSGTVYHLWQLPELAAKGVEPGIEFSELRNDLGDGYSSQALYGANTGLKSWSVKLPTLSDDTITPTVTGVNGETTSREAYVWDLYCETRVTGQPFVYQCPRNGQYYLVEFVDKKLKYAKDAYVKMYSTGLELTQVRLDGETIFDVDVAVDNTSAVIMTWLEGTNLGASWVANTGGSMGVNGDVVKATAVQNGLDVARFSNTTNDGYVSNGLDGLLVNDAFFVMKVREATFSNNCGIFTGNASGSQILLGSSGTTKFQNPSLTGYTYEKNGIEYAQSNLQAPMNTFGIVHVRYETGWTLPGSDFQFGKDRTTAGTFAEVDIGEIVVISGLLAKSVVREMTEYLAVKWGIS